MAKIDEMDENLDKESREETIYTHEDKGNFRFILSIIGILLFCFCLRTYWVQNFGGIVVDGASMNQTLNGGDKLLVRYAQAGVVAKRGDIIIVDVRDYEECGNTDFLIKRLIATEGDKVKCEDGNLYICYAGQTEYTYVEESYAYYYLNKADYDFEEYEVGKGEIFFLGDNRQNSLDSRYKEEYGGSHLSNGLYKAEDIYGVVPDWAIAYKTPLEWLFFRNI